MNDLYKIHKTMSQMLHDRGYNTKEENVMSLEDFVLKFERREKLTQLVYSKDENSTSKNIQPDISDIMVSYITATNKGGSVGKDQFKEFLVQLETKGITNGIIISNSLSAEVKKSISQIEDKTRIRFFKESHLYFPIVYHRLQPGFNLVTPDILTYIEKFQVRKEGETDEEVIAQLPFRFPQMLDSDPVAIYYDYRVGDLILTDRKPYLRVVTQTIEIPKKKKEKK